uniref:CSON008210 protein n=1 Tax=Culicoides sonorensis TaxID=179676 RepID=A0A336LKI6_CULSO
MDFKGILSYDEETCRLCLTPQSGVININSSISPKFGRIIDMVRYCYDIEMISNDALPSQICNECTLHLNVAYSLKGKCLTTEKYFLNYLTADNDQKCPIMGSEITDSNLNKSSQIIDLYKKKNNATQNSSERQVSSLDQYSFNSSDTSKYNEGNKKYTRPNLMVYFNHDVIIELSDTDSDTDNENETSQHNKYECPACSENFPDLFTFNWHVKDHPKKQCKVCSRMCGSGQNLIIHFRSHRPDQKIKCPHCDYSSCSKNFVYTHIRKNHNEGGICQTNKLKQLAKCKICGIFCSCIEEFRVHLYKEHKFTVQNNIEASKYITPTSAISEELKCNQCHRQFNSSISYSLHLKLHEAKKLKFCYICNLSFKHNMFTHFKMVHPGLPPYKCLEHCNETFRNQKLFEAHQKSIKKRSFQEEASSSDKNSVQKISKYSLSSEVNRSNSDVPIPPVGYVYRQVSHTELYDCFICDFKTENEQILIEHVEIHKTKKCKKCFRIFGNFRALKGHFKLKHPLEELKDAYECKDCGKTFDTFISLKRHQLQQHQTKKSIQKN